MHSPTMVKVQDIHDGVTRKEEANPTPAEEAKRSTTTQRPPP